MYSSFEFRKKKQLLRTEVRCILDQSAAKCSTMVYVLFHPNVRNHDNGNAILYAELVPFLGSRHSRHICTVSSVRDAKTIRDTRRGSRSKGRYSQKFRPMKRMFPGHRYPVSAMPNRCQANGKKNRTRGGEKGRKEKKLSANRCQRVWPRELHFRYQSRANTRRYEQRGNSFEPVPVLFFSLPVFRFKSDRHIFPRFVRVHFSSPGRGRPAAIRFIGEPAEKLPTGNAPADATRRAPLKFLFP